MELNNNNNNKTFKIPTADRWTRGVIRQVSGVLNSFPGKSYWGRVSFIASEAEFTPKQIQTKEERVKLVYRIKIDVENPQHELKLNMPADAEILPEQQ